MGRKAKDLTGRRYGRLTVISYNEEVSKQKGRVYWNCKCDCGNEVIIRGDNLRSENTMSCGCYNRDKTKEQWKDEEFRQMQSNKTKELWEDEEYRQMRIDKAKEQMKERWQDEEFRKIQSEKMKEQWQNEEFRQTKTAKMTRDGNPNWKSGITPISTHLRNLNEQWFTNCKQQANYTCELTGKVGGNLHTHHLKAFSTIVLEAHELHNIQIHEIIGEYTKEELHKLEEYVASRHKDNSNAVVLCDEVHTLFHSLYGYGNNTKEQFEEFKQRNLNGEFKDLLGDDLDD